MVNGSGGYTVTFQLGVRHVHSTVLGTEDYAGPALSRQSDWCEGTVWCIHWKQNSGVYLSTASRILTLSLQSQVVAEIASTWEKSQVTVWGTGHLSGVLKKRQLPHGGEAIQGHEPKTLITRAGN